MQIEKQENNQLDVFGIIIAFFNWPEISDFGVISGTELCFNSKCQRDE